MTFEQWRPNITIWTYRISVTNMTQKLTTYKQIILSSNSSFSQFVSDDKNVMACHLTIEAKHYNQDLKKSVKKT